MKYLNIILVGLLVALFVNCETEKKNKLEGVWQLVSSRATYPDTTIEATFDSPQADWKQMKVITKSHFVWIGQEPNRAKFLEGGTDSERLAASKTFNAGGGTYTLEGDTYTEHIEFFLNPNVVGASIPFKCQIEGDQWIHSGTMPLKSLGLAEYDYELYEVWKRVE